jgi:hypothetical protein
MLSLNECKKIIKAKENGISDEQLKQIKQLFELWAELEFKNYQSKNEERNIIYQGEQR